MPFTIYLFLTAFAALVVYAALLAAKRSPFPADGCQVALDPKPVALVSPLNGPQKRASGVSRGSRLCRAGADKRCGEYLTAGGAINREADYAKHELELLKGGNTSLHRSPLNRRAHNLGRWLAISPTFNFPASDSHLGSSEKSRKFHCKH